MLNGKFKCVSTLGTEQVTVGKIYEFKNGYTIKDNGSKSCNYKTEEDLRKGFLSIFERVPLSVDLNSDFKIDDIVKINQKLHGREILGKVVSVDYLDNDYLYGIKEFQTEKMYYAVGCNLVHGSVKTVSNDDVNHPNHYTKGNIEVIDFIEDQELDFRLANAVKYICRQDIKGTPKKDLEKAIWYIKRYIDKEL